jgi:D-glycero-alpha-D-manno-heptose-7-phosphate kinase
VPPYPDEQGGFVCNIAIARYATATVAPSETYREADESPLVNAVLRRLGFTGAAVTMQSDFPVGSGLGGSSSACAALVTALNALKDQYLPPAELAELGRQIEVEELGIAGGRQDHYAAACGGALALTFGKQVGVERVAIAPSTRADFEQRALLVYTGESRLSGRTVSAVLDAYRRGDPQVCNALERMKSLARAMPAALRAGDMDLLGSLVAEHWTHQRSLHPEIPTARIDQIVEAAQRAGAVGWKAMGASGGGCVLVIAARGRDGELRAAVSPLGELMEVRIADEGATVVQ